MNSNAIAGVVDQTLGGAQSEKGKDFYTNRFDGLDRQIEALAYDLYTLTPAEIKIPEEAPTSVSTASSICCDKEVA
jgi:hypothetical protein